MSKAVTLDVDPTIIEKNLMITEESRELDSLFPKQENPSKLIKPSPGFCLKIKSNESDEKIFINVCHTHELPEPEDLSETALLDILQSEARSNYRIPMSIGQCRPVTDKQGNPAKAYDVAINTKFLNKIEKSSIFKEFFITLVLEAVEDKYNIPLNRDTFSVLKNRKCIGTLQLHRIQKREIEDKMDIQPKPLIEEMKSNEKQISTKSIINKVPIHYRLIKQPSLGNIENIIGEFKLPEIQTADDIILDVGEDRIILETKNYGYNLDIFFPHVVIPDKVKASFNKNNKILTVTMPVDG